MIASFTAGSLLLGLALVLVVGLFLLRPFLRHTDPNFATEEQIESLLAQKDALLLDLRSLDSDMEAGKVAPELYAHDRPLLMRRAALVLQQLDELGYHELTTPVADAGLDEQIEAAVRQLRTTAVPAADDTYACPHCGRAVDPDDRFCASCGESLLAESPSASPA